jgi:hypothetical protein
MQDIQEFIFSAKAKEWAGSVPTTTLYQVLLGRDPENSHVIDEAKTQPIEAVFLSFVRSAEFAEFVVTPLRAGARLRHELSAPAPDSAQLHWLASLLVLPTAQHEAICGATSWPRFFEALLGLSRTDEPSPISGARVPAKTAAPSFVSTAMEEIAAIELRLDRLKTLLRDLR